tara:strand:+ start:26418 stop:28796 length:2379 start_codon:yes stop_codon:yes gene_type:complete
MPLVSRTIPNLVQGVSQQPEILRLPSQADEQVNGFSSVVEGLKKRPPSKHIAKISTTSFANSFVHTINRDVTERYVISISANSIKVFEIDGTERTVVAQTGALNYLDATNPKQDYVATTVADFTFILNKQKVPQFDSTVTSGAKVEQAVYTVLQGVSSASYSLTIDNTQYTSGGSTNGETIRDNLFSAIQGSPPTDVTVVKIGVGSIGITKSSGTLAVSSSDGYGNDASQVVKDTVQNFSDLPSPAINNMVVEVTGDAGNTFDNYYVKFEEFQDGDGVWKETVKPDIQVALDPTTLPHSLIRTADGNFRFTQLDGTTYQVDGTDFTTPKYGQRVAGDEDSAPTPSFIGRKLNDLFFHRNRLGFLSDENVIMSRAGEFFDFFPETVTQLLDTDPIDIASTHTKVSILRHAISFDEELLLFSDQTQFIMSGEATLTASNVAINVATEFEADRQTKPKGAGSNVFFTFPKGDFTGMREFFIASDTDTKQADDITANVPVFIPKNVFKITSATNENILAILSSDSPNCIYIYQYYVSSGKRLQSAWHKWDYGLATTDNILNIDFIENTLIIVNERSDGVYLEKVDVSPARVDTGATYLTHLDRKLLETEVTKSYDSATNITTITLPYVINNTMKVVGRVGGTNKAGREILTNTQSGTSITVSGDITNFKFFVGEQYEFLFKFSQQFVQLADSNGARISVKEGRLQIRNWSVSFNNTGFFQTEVTPKARDTSSSTFTGTITGAGLLGTVNLEDGDFKFSVQSRNDNLSIVLKNNSHLPSNFINANWEGYYVTQSQDI